MKKPEIYNQSSILHDEHGKPYINVNLAGQKVNLPMQLVKTNSAELLLAWVDAKREEITTYGALALSELLDEVNPSIVISPFSSKSIPMATQAVGDWNSRHNRDVPLFVLYGGKDEKIVKSQIGSDGFYLNYNPVTSTQQAKYIGLSQHLAHIIQKELSYGNKVAILDDVYGTGATVNAVRKIIALAVQHKIKDSQLPVLVVSRELEGEYEEQKIDSVLASIIIPIIRVISE
ncbi:hypothetical protein KC660_03325 [Candidatus Dojkabacteria bacterium]|uniref:Phosphoribosyltransferase domain-containing protein n=1 Tax=Candidatus Dojkabacteria bacterium TaxID=2099670 RepID=A0A955RII0_9BACT|nr:hypothetical protein [Candidatus Dojkabacteria bacterium]